MAGGTSGTGSFVHLHTHTEFSMLDGAARLDDLFSEAAKYEMPAIAMTDHGNVYGAFEFWRKAKAAGIKPIIGMEGYLAPGSRHERKRTAREIIEELEPTRRGLYGGIVGYFDFAGDADTAIAIRTAVIQDGRLYVQAMEKRGFELPENLKHLAETSQGATAQEASTLLEKYGPSEETPVTTRMAKAPANANSAAATVR